ncbi:hypothetical protein FGO68_gene10409 [Halteria grandinella]|uniref:Ubiquitin-like domain-containing protein n=1 Tax=Halteria grandinella TaxID=5974 RepID=A0A8J8NJR6_HALGN|nr:hypothetical protein FGO68_gene10409 [Halteria grandinella]
MNIVGIIDQILNYMGNLNHRPIEEPKDLFTVIFKPFVEGFPQSQLTMRVHAAMKVKELRDQFKVEHDIEAQIFQIDLAILQDDKLLQDYDIKEGTEIKYFGILAPVLLDIGVFDEDHYGRLGSEILKQGGECDVKGVVEGLKGNANAKYELYEPGLITEQSIIMLKEFADKRYESERVDDLKIPLHRVDLIELTSEKEVKALERLFSCQYNEILIRRCEAHGKFINFHLDHSKRTLQVALNDDFQGGKLIYLTGGQMHTPARLAGSITIHENDIVHGVSLLNSGIRYGLFMLQT